MMTADPAAIMLRVMMPVHDGIWLTEQYVRAGRKRRDHGQQRADMETVMHAQARRSGHVTKPFGREMLRRALRRASGGWPNSITLYLVTNRRAVAWAEALAFGIRASDFFAPDRRRWLAMALARGVRGSGSRRERHPPCLPFPRWAFAVCRLRARFTAFDALSAGFSNWAAPSHLVS
jgi:hypothetical protein